MPFKKVAPDDYTSPSGRHFNGAQVRMWHANGNKFPGQSSSEDAMSKAQSFATGGPVLGRTKDFMKTPDRFRDAQFKKDDGTEDNFGKKGGKNDAPAPKGKSLSPVKPRK